MSDFVWEWPVTRDAWSVDQRFDAKGTHGCKFITNTIMITRTTEREFTCGCSFTINVNSDLNEYTIGQLRGTAKQQLGGAVHETTIGKVSKTASTTTNFGNKKSSSTSSRQSTAPQQTPPTLASAVLFSKYIFFYSVLCKDIHFFCTHFVALFNRYQVMITQILQKI